MNSGRRVLVVLISILCVFGAAFSVTASSSARPSNRVAVFAPHHRIDASAVKQYWTRARMAHAEDRGIVVDPGGSLRDLVRIEPARGQEVSIAPTRPLESAPLRSEATLPNRMSASTTGGTVSIQSTEIPDPTTFPAIVHGRLFGTDSIGDFACSATVVPSDGKNLLWTAGHCVFEDGEWATSFLFVPGYKNGAKPRGEWVGTYWAAPPEWTQSHDLTYDFAAILMKPNGAGQQIEDAVGAEGIAFNGSRNQTYLAYGYPAKPTSSHPDYNGEHLFTCSSQNVGADPYGNRDNPNIGIDCDMTEGSSGGGWITGGNQLSSVTSYTNSLFPSVLFGPYLGAEAKSLYDSANSMSTNPSPMPSSTDGGGAKVHPMELTLSLKKHLIAKGHMTATDGYLACTRNALVGVFRVVANGTDVKLVGTDKTDAKGNYQMNIKEKPGTYVAYSPDGLVDDDNYCSEAISSAKNH